MLNFETIEPQHPADACVICLHGLGANGFDLMGTAPLLGLPDTHTVRFIFPHAPKRPVTISGGMAMPAWYDITGFTLKSREDFSGLEHARYQIDLLIDHEIARGINPARIFLSGFSQGGALTLFAGLQSHYPLAGLIVLSAYLPCQQAIKKRLTIASRRTPILMAHGTRDSVVLYEWGEIAKNELLSMGCALEWHSYPIAHEICAPELRVCGQFIENQLSS